jgi:hypothetical protein
LLLGATPLAATLAAATLAAAGATSDAIKITDRVIVVNARFIKLKWPRIITRTNARHTCPVRLFIIPNFGVKRGA